jgi:hypothetical protein
MTNSDPRPDPYGGGRPAPDEIEPGVPATSEMPANIAPGGEDEEEPPPRDYPQGVDDWGTTAREEALGESVASRAAREEPDFGERILSGDDPATASDLAPEEAAISVDDDPPGLNYDPDPGYVAPD